MSFVLSTGTLAVSIDLELDPFRRYANQQQSLEAAGSRLLGILARHRIAATWGVADPAVSAATERLTATSEKHEIAVLGDHTWVGHEAGRSRFAKELHRRVLRGRSAQLPITSLLLRDATLDEHLDLAIKHGITAVRGPYYHEPRGRWFSRPAAPQPHALKFGLWEIAPAQRLPGESRVWPGGGGWLAARAGIERAIAQRSVFHLLIDALDFDQCGSGADRTFDKIVRHAARRQKQGLLAIMTLSALAARISGVRQATPARSILRPAA